MHLRNVPTNPACLGKDARATEPDIKQVFITGVTDADSLERTSTSSAKKIEKRVRHTDFYIVSLSAKNIIYKGMLSSMQVREYFPDLTQPYFTTDWHWYTPVSAPTHFLHGASPNRSVC